PKTIINFQLPMSNFVKLIVYDVLGKEVAVLVNEQLKHGTYEVEWNASNYPSGVYFYKIVAGDYSETKRMALVK
ncbi:MAG: T9SS C-terminal target domain-containing protein, partial [Ignavibacteriae bacterium]